MPPRKTYKITKKKTLAMGEKSTIANETQHKYTKYY